MYINIDVKEKPEKTDKNTVKVHVYERDDCSDQDIKLTGSTFPIVPVGTTVDRLSMKIPGGLQGFAFFCKMKGPRRIGSGKTAYLDHTLKFSTSVLLSWEENGKLIVKADKDMSASELGKFNSFVRSTADVLVVDLERKIAYVSDIMFHEIVDQAWEYKSVPMNEILKYITKKMTIEELNERVTSERSVLQDLRHQNMNRLEEYRTASIRAHNEVKQKITDTKVFYMFYKFIKRIPAKFRPKMFYDFIEAMDSFKPSAIE